MAKRTSSRTPKEQEVVLTEAVAAEQAAMLDAQADTVAYDCAVRITGSVRPFNRSEALLRFGVNSDQQCQLITGLVVSDSTLGVPRFGFQMTANALRDLSAGWTMGQLSGRIQASATATVPKVDG